MAVKCGVTAFDSSRHIGFACQHVVGFVCSSAQARSNCQCPVNNELPPAPHTTSSLTFKGSRALDSLGTERLIKVPGPPVKPQTSATSSGCCPCPPPVVTAPALLTPAPRPATGSLASLFFPFRPDSFLGPRHSSSQADPLGELS